MKRNLVALSVMSAVILLTTELAYAAPVLRAKAAFYVCTADNQYEGGANTPGFLPTYYVTGAFSANTDMETLHKAWANYLTETYHMPKDLATSGNLCAIYPDKEAAERGRSNYIKQHPADPNSKGTVQVNWAYSAGK